MPLDLALDLAHALDPVSFVQDRLKFEPDPWQAQLLRSRASWILLNCCRQSGKSTTTAALAGREVLSTAPIHCCTCGNRHRDEKYFVLGSWAK